MRPERLIGLLALSATVFFPGVAAAANLLPLPPAPSSLLDDKATTSPSPKPPSRDHQGSLGEYFRLEAQKKLLKTEAANAALKKEISAKDPLRLEEGGAGPSVAVAVGMGRKRRAVLVWPNGRRMEVSLGENLPWGRVSRIDGTGVRIGSHLYLYSGRR